MSTAYLVRSTDYQKAAEDLFITFQAGSLVLRSTDPIDLLVGHAFELALKSLLLRCRIKAKDPRSFGHDVAKLYRFLREHSKVPQTAEAYVERKWTEELLKTRKIYLDGLGEFAMFDNLHKTPSDRQVREWRFDLYNSVKWFSEHMTQGGSIYRYHRDRLESGHQWTFAGKEFHEPRQSLLWATDFLNKQV